MVERRSTQRRNLLVLSTLTALLAALLFPPPASGGNVDFQLYDAATKAEWSVRNRDLLQAPAPANETTATGRGGGIAPTMTAGATLPGDITAVRSCLPYSILILPGAETAGMGATGAAGNASASAGVAGGNATIVMAAEEDVINATDITYSQTDGILSLAISQGYSSNRVINLTITTAANSSLRYVQNFGPGNVVVGPGFDVDVLSVAATSIGGVLARGLTAAHVYVTNTGMGTVTLNGTISDADIVAGGTSKVYLAGNTTGNVTVAVDGISTTWIQGSPTALISGTANGLAKVLYTDGTCNVQPLFQSIFGINVFGDPCQKVAERTGPSAAALWSCGQRVDGQSSCPVEVSAGGEGGVGLAGAGKGGGGGEAGAGPATPASTGGGNVNTVGGKPGQVTTGTFTTPGGSASASGSVSGPSGAIGGQQTSEGGSPPIFSASSFPPMPDIFNNAGMPSVDTGSGLDPDFMGMGSSSAVSRATSTGGPAFASSVSGPGQHVTSTSSSQDLLNIPSTSSGLSVISLTCSDPPSSRVMIPTTPAAAAGGTGTTP